MTDSVSSGAFGARRLPVARPAAVRPGPWTPAALREYRLTGRVATIYVICVLVLSGMQFTVGELVLGPARLALMVLVFPAFFSLVQRMGEGRFRLIGSDVAVVAASLWMLVSVMVTQGIEVALQSSGVLILEFTGSYMIGRGILGTRIGYGAFYRRLRWAIFVLIGVALLDILTGRNVMALVGQLLGGPPGDPPAHRFGLVRASGMLAHPILYGTLCALCAPLLVMPQRLLNRQLFWMGVCGFGCLLSLSSAPMLAFMLFVAVFTYDTLLSAEKARWPIFWIAVLLAFVALFLLVDRPLETLIRNLTLDPQTGYYRLLIWIFAGDVVLNAPMFGIGFVDWPRPPWMPPSIDSVWLALAVQFGIPGSALIGLSTLAAGVKLGGGARPRPDPVMDRVRTGLSFVLVTAAVVGFTVHYWGTMWIFLGLVAGLRAGLEEQRYVPAR